MTVDTRGFRQAHDHLLEQTAELRIVARRYPTLAPEEREEARHRVLRKLRRGVAPHTRLDEQLLYPEVSHRVGTPLLAASMNYDHRAIRRWIERLESADIADVARMQELLYGLDALIRVHVRRTSCI
jgi:hypothetical protein